MLIKLYASVAVLVVPCAVPAWAQPDIGGMPVYWEADAFAGSPAVDWGVEVTSYVFDSSTDLPAGFNLETGQLLFMYLLDGDDQRTVSVDKFAIGNPEDMSIVEVGYSDDIAPDGFAFVDYENPYLYSYSAGSQATIYTYAGDFSDPYSTLEPDEWSLVWYVAEAGGWTLGSATASGGGYGDTQLVPVPIIPHPGAIALLGLAGLSCMRRRTR